MSALIGSIAAAIECEVDGNIPIEVEKIIKKINLIEKQLKI